MIFTNLSKNNLKEFRNILWDTLDTYIDAHEDDEPADFKLLQTIFGKLTKEETYSLSDIFQDITQHVQDKGYDKVSECFQELYDIKNNPDYAKIFIEDNHAFAKAVIKEPTKEKLIEQISNFKDVIDRDELLLLIMHETSQKMPFNGHLVDGNKFTLLPFNKEELEIQDLEERGIVHSRRENQLLFADIDRVIQEDTSGSHRIQIVVKLGKHYTTVDIDKNTGSCFIVDAIDDSAQYTLHHMARYSQFVSKVYYVVSPLIPTGNPKKPEIIGTIQKDSSSCSIYAIDHAIQLASDPDIHSWLESNATQKIGSLYYVVWNQLSPEMVKNAQSTTVLEYYMQVNPNQREKLLKLTANNAPFYGLENTKETFSRFVYNYCYNYSEAQLQEKMRQTSSEKFSHGSSVEARL